MGHHAKVELVVDHRPLGNHDLSVQAAANEYRWVKDVLWIAHSLKIVHVRKNYGVQHLLSSCARLSGCVLHYCGEGPHSNTSPSLTTLYWLPCELYEGP